MYVVIRKIGGLWHIVILGFEDLGICGLGTNCGLNWTRIELLYVILPLEYR